MTIMNLIQELFRSYYNIYKTFLFLIRFIKYVRMFLMNSKTKIQSIKQEEYFLNMLEITLHNIFTKNDKLI